MFGSSEAISKQDSTWQERAMGSYLRGAWAAFAACPSQGLTQYGWTRYSNTTDSLQQLGFDDPASLTYNVMPTLNSSMAYDTLCGTFPVSFLRLMWSRDWGFANLRPSTWARRIDRRKRWAATPFSTGHM